MMKIDPLYLWLLVELSCILAAGVVFLFLRAGKYRKLHRSGLKELSALKQTQEDLNKQLASLRNAAAAQAEAPVRTAKPAQPSDAQLDDLKARLQAAQEALKAKTEQLDHLQVKFTDLEKEYMVLYHQQQKQQGL